MEKAGIEYKNPEVYLLDNTDLAISEIAARTCYNSFDKSENKEIEHFNENLENQTQIKVENSKLLEQLTWVYFHESILEHIVFNFYLKDFSRGVLQELARHRIASYSVQSTRYTMGDILLSFVLSRDFSEFEDNIEKLKCNPFIIKTLKINKLLQKQLFEKLQLQRSLIGIQEFNDLILSKEQKEIFENSELTNEDIFKIQKAKSKRNVGDNFKWIVDDNWGVDAVVTFNLRSLKNFIKLRNSGAAYFQIQELAKQIIQAIPEKFKSLIFKEQKKQE